MEEGRAAGVCGRTPGATVWKVLPSAGAKSALCVHSSTRTAAPASSAQSFKPTASPREFALRACSGRKHARLLLPATTASLPGRAPVSPRPLCRTANRAGNGASVVPRAKDADMRLTSPATRPLTCVCGLWVKALAIAGCSRAQPPEGLRRQRADSSLLTWPGRWAPQGLGRAAAPIGPPHCLRCTWVLVSAYLLQVFRKLHVMDPSF